jgi:hypothetical protein
MGSHRLDSSLGGCRVSVGAAARRCAVFPQKQHRVVVGVTASVPLHGRYQRIQRLVAVSHEKRRCDLVFWEEVSVLVTAFDQPASAQNDPIWAP